MMSSNEISTFDTMKYLKDQIDLDEEKVTTNAKKIVRAVAGLFFSVFTLLFGSIISHAGNNVIVFFLSIAIISLSAIFLYYYIKTRTENITLKKEQVVMARKQVGIVDYLTQYFKKEFSDTMNSLEKTLETRYSDTIVGLTCQLNDLVKAMCEEREKLHTLLAVMTTDPTNGIENMTTEVE